MTCPYPESLDSRKLSFLEIFWSWTWNQKFKLPPTRQTRKIVWEKNFSLVIDAVVQTRNTGKDGRLQGLQVVHKLQYILLKACSATCSEIICTWNYWYIQKFQKCNSKYSALNNTPSLPLGRSQPPHHGATWQSCSSSHKCEPEEGTRYDWCN